MRIIRSPDPGPFNDYRDYKPHLRPLFRYRCAYCVSHEDIMGRSDAMEIDHFRPGSRPEFKHLEKAWPNLYYSCRLCNGRKGCRWPTEEEEHRGLRFVDPCVEDPDDHLRLSRHPRHGDFCWVISPTGAGRYTIDKIGLNRDQLVQIRRSLVAEEREEQALLSLISQSITRLSVEVERKGPSATIEQVMRDLREEHQLRSARLTEIRSLRPFPVEEESKS